MKLGSHVIVNYKGSLIAGKITGVLKDKFIVESVTSGIRFTVNINNRQVSTPLSYAGSKVTEANL